MGEDIIGDLERLTRLRDSGALSEHEFAVLKGRLLGTACPSCGAPLQLDAEGRCIYCHEAADSTLAAAPSAPTGDDADDAIARAYPKHKIAAIKALREQTGLGLREAKDRMDAAYRRVGL